MSIGDMRDELFDLDIQDIEEIMNGFDRLVHEQRALHNDQRKNDALNYYLKQGNTIDDAMYMAGYKSDASLTDVVFHWDHVCKSK
tara:strand:+ start:242 stop:496 length:255 start_codon:yes stop_codon:yes gene_type:complete